MLIQKLAVILELRFGFGLVWSFCRNALLSCAVVTAPAPCDARYATLPRQKKIVSAHGLLILLVYTCTLKLYTISLLSYHSTCLCFCVLEKLLTAGVGQYPSLYPTSLHSESGNWDALVKASESLLKEKELIIER